MWLLRDSLWARIEEKETDKERRADEYNDKRERERGARCAKWESEAETEEAPRERKKG